jgi:hypothetical protein
MTQGTGTSQGRGASPASNLEYDLITILHNKLEALAVYETYLRDAQGNQEATKLIQECVQHDQQVAQRLRQVLANVLQQGGQAQAGARAAGANR